LRHPVVTESFLSSKAGAPDGGEDRLVLGPHYFGVIDGATSRRGPWGKRPAGEILAESLQQLLCDARATDPTDLVEAVNQTIETAAKAAGVDLTDVNNRADVAFAAYVPSQNAVYHIHDCGFGFLLESGEFIENREEKLIDTYLADLRTAAVAFLRGQGQDPFADGQDLGRAFIAPFLDRLPELQNIEPSDGTRWAFGLPRGLFAYKTFNGLPTTIDITAVPPSAQEIILASDGFPRLFPTLAETRAYLETTLQADPECLQHIVSSKGRAPGNKSHDDLSYVRLQLD
jgi:hypothetical protein